MHRLPVVAVGAPGSKILYLWFAVCALTSGDIPEEAYYQQQKVQVDLLDLFRMVDQAANGSLTGTLPRREIRVLLKGKPPIAPMRPKRQPIP